MAKDNKIILGLDPGIADVGFGIIEKNKKGIRFIKTGSIKTVNLKSFSERLEIIYKKINKLIIKYKPDIIGVEKLYFARNIKTALDVSEARGVIILACQSNSIEIEEFTPTQVKQAVTGSGIANKRQVGLMVKTILKLNKVPKPDDASDALAVAIATSIKVIIKQK